MAAVFCPSERMPDKNVPRKEVHDVLALQNNIACHIMANSYTLRRTCGDLAFFWDGVAIDSRTANANRLLKL